MWQHRFVELNQDNSSLIMAFDIDREDAWEWVDTLIQKSAWHMLHRIRQSWDDNS